MTAPIQRCPQQYSTIQYDTVIVGGGIYGAMLLLEAARKGLSALMIERHDFGSGTTSNNFRIVHGGLRSLQSGDLLRYRESVGERSWFLRIFPDLVKPIRCLMPYYGRGLKRTSIMKLASVINDVLSWDRNHDLRPGRMLSPTTVTSRDETINDFPMVNRDGLKGGLVWYDATMPDCHRIVIDVIRWACEYDAKALNYVIAQGLIMNGGSVTGVRARDMVSGDNLEFRAKTVICAVGPWTMSLPIDGGVGEEGYTPSRAWNVLLDRSPVYDGAVAVSPPVPDGQLYFVHSYREKLFVGTGHSGVLGGIDPENDTFPESLLEGFLVDINQAIPGLDLKSTDVIQVYDGFLPVSRAGSVDLTLRSAILDYGKKRGQSGLFIVVGVKFTIARSTAATVIDKVCRKHFPAAKNIEVFRDEPRTANPYRVCSVNDDALRLANELIASESAVTLDDLMLRRFALHTNEQELESMRSKLRKSSALMTKIED